MTHMTLQAVRQLIANDSYAITFQSLGQYRGALLRHFDTLVDGAQPYATGGIVPGELHLVGEGFRALGANAGDGAQPAVTRDEALYALDLVVNKMHVPGLSGQRAFALDVLKRAEGPAAEFANGGQEPDSKGYAGAERAQQAAAPGPLLVILRDVHDTLESQADSDIDHFEDDEEEREAVPMQYAARRVMEAIQLIEKPAASPVVRAQNEESTDALEARRYRAIRSLMSQAKGSASFVVNQHLAYYEEPEVGREVALQWYPDTPIGFYVIEGSTIDEVADEAIDAAIRAAQEGGAACRPAT